MTSEPTVVCSRCGFANAPGDQFCGSCGAFLEWEGTAAAGAPPAPGGPGTAASPGAPPAGATPPPSGPPTPSPAAPPGAPPAAPPTAPPGAPGATPEAGELVRCPSCGIANPASRTFCQTCGAKLMPGAVVGARTREEVAAAVESVPGAPPRPVAARAATAGSRDAAAGRGGRRLPGWILAVVVLGVLVGVGGVLGSQLLKGAAPASGASALPNPSGLLAASSSPGASEAPSAPPASPSHPAPTPTPSPVAGKPLKLTSASASSILGGNTGRYGPQNAIDGSLKTSWQEGAATEQGQWIEVGFAPATVSGIVVRNGFQASTALFKGNLRLKAIEISVDGGAPVKVTLKDTTAAQRFTLPPVAGATQVRITIESTYPAVKTSVNGTPFKDAAISEISVLGVAGG